LPVCTWGSEEVIWLNENYQHRCCLLSRVHPDSEYPYTDQNRLFLNPGFVFAESCIKQEKARTLVWFMGP
jgi:hypothetical protein